jgi:release factor glutamine methyltransferase
MNIKIPELTKAFMLDIEENAKKGIVQYTFGTILIDVFPYVFPPERKFSKSFREIQNENEFKDQEVLDLGTGTGIQAIYAAISGASLVDAVDIFPTAVRCAKHNVRINNLESKITVQKSDLFSNVPKKQYDTIFANLPILNLPQKDVRFHSLFDPEFQYHKNLLLKAQDYLHQKGKMIIPFANLLGERDFPSFECLIEKSGYSWKVERSSFLKNHEFRSYVLRVS